MTEHGCVDEVAGNIPGFPSAEPHAPVERAIHSCKRNLQDINLSANPEVIGLGRMAHPVPEPDTVGIPDGGVVAEPGTAEVLPALWDRSRR